MEKENNLSEKIEVNSEETMHEYNLDEDERCWVYTKDVREKIQNTQKKLHTFICSKIEGEILLPKKDIKEIYGEIDKIFKEEFWEKLINE